MTHEVIQHLLNVLWFKDDNRRKLYISYKLLLYFIIEIGIQTGGILSGIVLEIGILEISNMNF